MLENILPENISKIINSKINYKAINEIRIRADKPIIININGQVYFLSENGLSSNLSNSLKATKIMVEDIIFRASECSLYSVNEQIKQGFIVTKGGIRIGIGGSIIEDNKTIKTMNDFTSVNIRIPHHIKNCSLSAFNSIVEDNKVKNTLIISPPGCGKTTFLRDFICQLSERNIALNILVLDERGELDIGSTIGNFSDKICFARKKIGFENGIRTLSPNIIVTDELNELEDLEAILYAVNCGVNLLASTHADSIETFLKKESFSKVIKEKVFKRYVVLSNRNGPGTYEGIYNENFSRLH